MPRKTPATTERTETTTWSAAVKAAASIDPPPKKFVARLTCTLTDRELAEHGRKCADADAELENFDADTKQIVATRKGDRAVIDARKKRHRQILATGREDRDIECMEHVSIRQGRRWRIRLDTGETYEEAPLTESERQPGLPFANATSPLPGDDDGADSRDYDGPEVDEPADGDGVIEVTDPETLLRVADDADTEH